MARPRKPHLHKEENRHGTTVWYVRIGKGPRVRVHGTFGTDEFEASYEDAIAGKPKTRLGGAAKGTLQWLADLYRQSSAWSDLSAATRRQRENILKQVLLVAGDLPVSSISARVIRRGVDKRAATPGQARHFVDTMRGLFRWAVKAELAKIDPTQGHAVPKPKTKGFPVWTEGDLEKFEKRWPIGTRERVMFDVYLYTGLRRGDAARLGKQHIRNGVITIDTEKTGTRVTIPVLPELAASIAAGPVGELSIIATKRRTPMRKESLGTLFKEACKAAGIDKSAHGIRKAAATRAANNGATVATLEAIFGWEGGQMAALYTRAADRKALAAAHMHKLARPESGTSIPAPDGQVRETR